MYVAHVVSHLAFLLLLAVLVVRVIAWLAGWAPLAGRNGRSVDLALASLLPAAGLLALTLGLALRENVPPALDLGFALRYGLALVPGALALVLAPGGITRALALLVVGFAAVSAVFDARFADGRLPLGPAALIAGLILGAVVPPRAPGRWPLAIGALGILAVALTALVGVKPDGCADCPRLALSLAGVPVQTFAMAKVLLALACAGLMAADLGPPPALAIGGSAAGRWWSPVRQIVMIVGAASALWVFNRDLGPALVVVAVAVTLRFLVHLPERRGPLAFWSAIAGSYAFVAALYAVPRFRERVSFLLGAGAPPEQLVQAWYSLGAGGPTGHGLGTANLAAVPLVSTDLVLAAVSQETGIVGVLLVVALAPLFLIAASEVTRRYLLRGDPLLALTALACGLLPAVQTVIITCGSLGCGPFTGIPWPGVSRGGSDLAALGFLLGMAVRLARGPILPHRAPWAAEEYLARDLARTPVRALALFLPVIVGVLHWMVWPAPALAAQASDTSVRSSRLADAALAVRVRATGTAILARDGKTRLASFRDGRYSLERPDLACALGLPAPDGAPIGGLAAAWLRAMAGDEPVENGWSERLSWLVAGRGPRLTLITALDPRLQDIATSALGEALVGDEEGAIAILDSDGGVAAMACAPFVSPAAALDPVRRAAALQDPRQLFLPRATHGLYACGSACKLLTYLAAFEHGVLTSPDELLAYPNGPRCPHSMLLDGTYNLTSPYNCGVAQVTARDAFAISDNLVAGSLGLKVGLAGIERTARTLGFWQPGLSDVPATISTLRSDTCRVQSQRDLAWLAYGQGCLQVSPMQVAAMALVGLRADGVAPRPHLVKAVRPTDAAQDRAVRFPEPGRLHPATARNVRELMSQAVSSGWARPASHPQLNTGGKTGTAERGDVPGLTNGWYGGFFQRRGVASAEGYAVAVLLARGGEGVRAARVAGQIAANWYRQAD